MLDETDEKILKLYRNGLHQDALKLLMETYQSRLYWHIRRIAISHDDTDDILQNTFVKIWRGLASFKQESKLYTWMFRIASNETFTHIEKNKKHQGHLDFDQDFHFVGTDHIDNPDAEYIQKKLEMAIAKLPEKQRMVFHLKYYEEMKYEQISDVLGTSVGALKANYHLAVKKIEEFLKED